MKSKKAVVSSRYLRLACAVLAVGLALPVHADDGGVHDAGTAEPALSEDTRATQTQELLRQAYQLKHEGDLLGAVNTFERAGMEGADPQLVALELGYIAAVRGEPELAHDAFSRASEGPSAELADEARQQLSALQPRDLPPASPSPTISQGEQLLVQAYEYKAARDVKRARVAFQAAAKAGAKLQLVALELGYLQLESNHTELAREEFERAAAGEDPELCTQAKRELAALAARGGDSVKRVWGDIYADAFGWSRQVGAAKDIDLVPTLRLRGYVTPFANVDLHLYGFLQVTRDLASRDIGAAGSPVIYADNKAMGGAGVLFRFWSRQVGIFVQAGPAVELVDSRSERVVFDLRAGAYLGLESASCSPSIRRGSRWTAALCHELYASVIYINRFQHNVIGFARGRSSLSIAITGPLEWQLTGELRVAKDSNGDFYNNFVDAGLGPRLRLLAPFRVDLMFAPHLGSYFGEHNVDPAPDPLHYMDLRVQAATYVEF